MNESFENTVEFGIRGLDLLIDKDDFKPKEEPPVEEEPQPDSE